MGRSALRTNSCGDWKPRFDEITPEPAKRLRFDGKKWTEDIVQVKIETEAFANGNIFSAI